MSKIDNNMNKQHKIDCLKIGIHSAKEIIKLFGTASLIGIRSFLEQEIGSLNYRIEAQQKYKDLT